MDSNLTKKCVSCGWEYAWDHPTDFCKFCGTRLPDSKCVRCGQKITSRYTATARYCKECYLQFCKDRLQIMRDKRAALYAEWLQDIRKLKVPHKLLTEEEWLNACQHFNGCAVCGEEEIDTRGFFITFKEGGRYCAWNIIPVCSRCASLSRKQPNPWRRFNPEQSSYKNILKIAEYLHPILERRINESKET